MKKIALALAATLASPPAMAGPYANVEVNNGYLGNDYQGRTVDLHVGYEGAKDNLAFYIQGGPAVTAITDVDGTDSELSGKVGASYAVSETASIYGEFSGISNGDEDNIYGTKLGAKFTF